jgi:ABC-type transporter Mla MlaB component
LSLPTLPPLTHEPGIDSRLLDDVAVTTVTGPLDRDGVCRLVALLQALQAGGVSRMLVDLTAAAADPSVVAGLASVGRRCTRLGGWLIVDGAPTADDGGDEDLELPLDRLFNIYLQSRPS